MIWALGFVGSAVIIYRLWIAVPGTHAALKVLGGATIFPLYGLVGLGSGLIFGATLALSRSLHGLEGAVQQILGPLLANAAAAMFRGRESVSVDEFNEAVDRLVRQLSQGSGRSGPSGRRPLGRFALGAAARLVRMTLVRQFLKTVEETGSSRVTPQAVERFATGKLTAAALGGLRGRIQIFRWLISLVSAVFLAGPLVLYFFMRSP